MTSPDPIPRFVNVLAALLEERGFRTVAHPQPSRALYGCPGLFYRHPRSRGIGAVLLTPLSGAGPVLRVAACLHAVRPSARVARLLEAPGTHMDRRFPFERTALPEELPALAVHLAEELHAFVMEQGSPAERYTIEPGAKDFLAAQYRGRANNGTRGGDAA